MWKSIHYITFGYPEHPTQEDKEKYKKYFNLLAYVIPCTECSTSFMSFISPGGELEIKDTL